MNPQKITYLYRAYLAGTLDTGELEEFKELVFEGHAVLEEIIDGDWNRLNGLKVPLEVKEDVFQFIVSQPQSKQNTQKRLWPRMVVAAAAVVTIVVGVWFFSNSQNSTSSPSNDVAPGAIGATLTLANGEKIKLSDAKNGEVANEAGIRISKTADGQLVYEVKGASEANKFNTLTTAKGETFVLILPDKSKVWMNAASSLTYSSGLIEDGFRVVQLDGEAYFEVVKNTAHPFIVKTRKQEVAVLGTHFNINSYPDENVIRTTLLEGKVKVSIQRNNKTAILQPNQQSTVNETDIIDVKEVNPNDVVAWTKGNFLFAAEDIKSIMHKLSRWYDIEVHYDGEVTKELYYGDISRFKNLSEVLNMLQNAGGVHFKIEGRRITVRK
ncbi:MAG: FecR family protein [Bacteroidota bacterium]